MFKLKKNAGALALTIALAQVVTVVPVHAEEITYVCSHSNCENVVVSEGWVCDACNEAVNSTGEVFPSVSDNTTHDVEVICGECNYEYVIVENCEYNDGSCICGRKENNNNDDAPIQSEYHTFMIMYNEEHQLNGSLGKNFTIMSDGNTYTVINRDMVNSMISAQILKGDTCNVVGIYTDEACSSEFSSCNVVKGEITIVYLKLDCNHEDENSSSKPTVSGNGISKEEPKQETYVSKAPTEEEIHAMKAAEIEARQKKTVTFESGKQINTSIDGVYEVASLSGTAVTTLKADVQKAIGLTDEQIASGTNVSIFMGNVYDKAVKDALNNAATASGKTVISTLISDMYTITKDGKITKLHTSNEPISMVFGLPKHAVDASRAYSVICITADGRIVEMKDTDTDANTITADVTAFGNYAIVY